MLPNTINFALNSISQWVFNKFRPISNESFELRFMIVLNVYVNDFNDSIIRINREMTEED